MTESMDIASLIQSNRRVEETTNASSSRRDKADSAAAHDPRWGRQLNSPRQFLTLLTTFIDIHHFHLSLSRSIRKQCPSSERGTHRSSIIDHRIRYSRTARTVPRMSTANMPLSESSATPSIPPYRTCKYWCLALWGVFRDNIAMPFHYFDVWMLSLRSLVLSFCWITSIFLVWI